MKVKTIMTMAAEFIGCDVIAEYLKSGVTDDVATTSVEVAKFNRAYNLVAEELASGFAPLIAVYKVNDVEEIMFSSLPEKPIEIISVNDKFGYELEYERHVDKIVFKKQENSACIRYRYLPIEKGIEEDADYGEDGKVTARVMAYGIASEYLQMMGAYTSSAEWRKKFLDGVKDCIRPRYKMVMPGRRWR